MNWKIMTLIRNSITAKIALLLFTGLLIILSLWFFMLYQSEKKEALENIQDFANNLRDRIAYSLVLPLWNYDYLQLEQIILLEMSNKNVQAIILKNQENQFLMGKIKDQNREIKDYSPKLDALNLKSALFILTKKIYDASHQTLIGNIEIYMTDFFYSQYFNQLFKNMLLYIFMLLVTQLLILFVFFKKIILNPVKTLSKVVKSFQDKNFKERSKINSRDELGELSQALNMMAETIEAYKNNLENLVSERTAQLEAINKELETFSYSVSHDLRAPLRSIDGFGQIIVEDYSQVLDQQGLHYLGRIREGAKKMGALIDALLNLSKYTRSELTKTTVDLSRKVREISKELAEGFPERQVNLIVKDCVTAVCDEKLIAIVLQNLLNNSFKFSSKKNIAQIEFGSIFKDGQEVYFIKDNGEGFNMEYSNKLFNAFQRLHQNSEFEGIGIGLATVKRIIKRHGGQIWAESEPGQGAVFYFTL